MSIEVIKFKSVLIEVFKQRSENLWHMSHDIKYIKDWQQIIGAAKIYDILINELKSNKLNEKYFLEDNNGKK